MSDWKSRATPVQPAKSSWRDRAEPVEKEKTGQLTAAIRGGVQGISGGFADELAGGIGGAIDYVQGEGDLKSLYEKNRDEQRAKNEQSKKDWPKTYNITQMGTSIVPTALTAGTSIPAMAASGAAQALGYSEADLTKGEVGQAAKDTAIGGVIGGGTGVAVQGVSKFTPTILKYLSGKLGKGAEDLAVSATGATGTQAAKFRPGAGRELLDKGIVGFGDTVENIADKAASSMDESGQIIDNVLSELDSKGVTASVDNVVTGLQSKVDDLSKIHGNEKLVNQLQGEIDNLIERGQSSIPIKSAEESKKVFQGNTNYNSPVSDQKASKYLANQYKEEVERAASLADPEAAKLFTQAKKDYGLIAPIQAAAEKRALANNQVAVGGLKDAVYAMAGGGPGVLFRNMVQPMVGSSVAVAADKVSKALAATPELFGKYAKVLTDAAAKGSANLAITHQVLQKDPEYQKILNGL